ncbi:MAG: type IV secretory system conjugative DNA transfer family protein, partial [Pseudomonadota bacterium]
MQAQIDDKYRASFNPLSMLDPDSPEIKEDIEAISDGIVKRDNPESSHWDDGAQAIISGLIAYLLLAAEPEQQNLIEMRSIMRNVDRLDAVLTDMRNMQGCGGLCESGASAAFAQEGGYFVSNAEKNTRWLDSQRMENSLVETTFTMRELKQGKASVFLVLPAKQLKNHGRFLRLFIRCAISEMMNPLPDGSEKGAECLFLLDEFFALGYIEEIMISVGLMRSMGLKLWPVLQDLGQLEKLYGREGITTFLSNSDLHQFFGNTDPQTLDFISGRIGNFTIDDLPDAPKYDGKRVKELQDQYDSMKGDRSGARAGVLAAAGTELKFAKEDYHERIGRFNADASRILGRPRLSPDQVAHMIRKEGEGLAKASIVFIYGSHKLAVSLLGHWQMNARNIQWPTSEKWWNEWQQAKAEHYAEQAEKRVRAKAAR